MRSVRDWHLADPFVSLVAFSFYSGVMGAVLLFAPRTILPTLRVADSVKAYTFMLGFVLLASSFYYLASGLARNRQFAQLTVYTRFASPVVTLWLFLGGNVPLNFVLLSILDGMGGWWTFATLRAPDAAAVPA